MKIKEMEQKSLTICEKCGKTGKRVTKNFWIKTLCEECSEN